MILIRDYIGRHFIGKNLHLTCDCILRVDIKGRCVDYAVRNDEIVLKIDVNGKIVDFGLNRHNAAVEVI